MRIAAIVLSLGLANVAVADERLDVATPDGFQLSLELSTDAVHIREFVPDGQNGEDWQEMLSLQSFRELDGLDPRSFLARVADTALMGCQGASADLVAETVEDGWPVAVTVMTCPYSHSTGGAETFVTKAISGGEGFYVVQASWRGALAPEPLQRWLDVLLEVGLTTG